LGVRSSPKNEVLEISKQAGLKKIPLPEEVRIF
jgi:hypothetical protein